MVNPYVSWLISYISWFISHTIPLIFMDFHGESPSFKPFQTMVQPTVISYQVQAIDAQGVSALMWATRGSTTDDSWKMMIHGRF